MQIQFYRPSKSGKGFACSFKDSAQGDCVFATILKQSGWDEVTQTGSFKGSLEDKEAKVIVKLNDLEVAAIIDCIESGRPFSTYHQTDNDPFPKTISFQPWMSKPFNEGEKPQQRGFSFTINITNKEDKEYKNAFYLGFSWSEARLVKEALINTLNSHFNKKRQDFLNGLNKGV